ncbi:MAG: hypothetical protein A3G34_00735 [Candidatus Lindowbacteria bacterium RIFCSPLOWO2_12_FULL_62_27]|nr:MAG: hypothetical protein A3G34_00735 [Candidatus Lindowbacteria bacterium RIFCSPLOWO2_12_FULL_62_27]OGH58166.1 MAG: hypothetical protein A3I06_00815 [Candidatus Lindowbacteria bacterium RIFCSPLOWO2_02_FULL_62_12]
MKRGRIEGIETIRRRFKKRKTWLLIEVAEYDPATTTAKTGRLLAHSPDRMEIHRVAMKVRDRGRMLMTVCSDETIPEDTAVCISVWPAWA